MPVIRPRRGLLLSAAAAAAAPRLSFAQGAGSPAVVTSDRAPGPAPSQRETRMDEEVWQDAPRWRDRWEVIGRIGEGWRGSAHLARRADGGDPTPRFLEVPKEQGNRQWRRAMAREAAAALHALRHPRIPRLVESNARRSAAAGDFELYIVTDHIAGPRLDQAVERRGVLAADPALALAGGLLDAVGHCHGRDRVHGDVKPGNVILRGGDPADPVLVDFGLSARRARAGATDAREGEEDERTDLTQTARVLFYALTGQYETPLRDWDGLAPHRRPDEAAALLATGGGGAPRLLELLDRAFAVDPEDRFQTAGEFRAALREVLPRPAVTGFG